MQSPAGTAPQKHTTIEEPLRIPAFLFFALARIATGLSYQMVGVAVGWQMYALTHSALALGLVGLAQFVPMVLLTLVVGHVADRHDRRSIALACQFGQGMLLASLAYFTVSGRLDVGLLYAAVTILGALHAFEMPTLQALVPSLVPPSLFPPAIARVASAIQTAVILGPALGGVLYAVHPGVVYGSAAALYALAAFFLGIIRTTLPPATRKTEPKENVKDSLFAGIHFIRERPTILGAISLDLFAVLLGGAVALLPIYARDVFHTGPWGLGLLRAAPAVGALLMSVWLGHHPLRRSVGRRMFAAVGVFGLATIAFALSRSLAAALLTLVVMGASDVVSVVIRQSLVQMQTPDNMRGRVSAVNSLFIGTSNQLGEFESGITAAWWGTIPATLIGGIGTIVVALAWMRLFPALRDRDALKEG